MHRRILDSLGKAAASQRREGLSEAPRAQLGTVTTVGLRRVCSLAMRNRPVRSRSAPFPNAGTVLAATTWSYLASMFHRSGSRLAVEFMTSGRLPLRQLRRPAGNDQGSP